MQTINPHAIRRRARGATIIIGAMIGALVATFFRAQVLRSDT